MIKKAIVKLTSIAEVTIYETVNGDKEIDNVEDTREVLEFEVLEEL